MSVNVLMQVKIIRVGNSARIKLFAGRGFYRASCDISRLISAAEKKFAVYMFGRVLENVWGPKRFLIFYFVTGIGAGLVQEVVWFFNLRDVIFASQDMINLNGAQIISKSEFLNYFVTIGASGAVFGILLAFAMIFPNVPLYLMFIPIPIKAKYFVIFYGLAELFMGVASFGGDTVAHFAHLGGMLFGYFLIRYWKKKDADNGRYFY